MLYLFPLSLQSLLIANVLFRAWQGTNVPINPQPNLQRHRASEGMHDRYDYGSLSPLIHDNDDDKGEGKGEYGKDYDNNWVNDDDEGGKKDVIVQRSTRETPRRYSARSFATSTRRTRREAGVMMRTRTQYPRATASISRGSRGKVQGVALRGRG